MNVVVNDESLFLAARLVVVSLGISYKEKLGLMKDIFMSVCRVIIQFIIVSYLLSYIFQVNNCLWMLIMTGMIIMNASFNAKKRSQRLKNGFMVSFFSVGSSTMIIIGVLVFSGTIRFILSQIIPISGMIASNSMVAVGLCYRNMDRLFQDQRQAVWEKLALGASIKIASQSIVRESIKTGMSPTVDSAKIVGIVSLSRMMSGLILFMRLNIK